MQLGGHIDTELWCRTADPPLVLQNATTPRCRTAIRAWCGQAFRRQFMSFAVCYAMVCSKGPVHAEMPPKRHVASSDTGTKADNEFLEAQCVVSVAKKEIIFNALRV